MANYYVKSAGNDSNSGTTWALAKATVWGTTGAMSVASGGDTIYCLSGGSESSTTTFNSGTFGSPVRVICTSDSTNEPPNAGTGAQYWTISGSGTSTFGGFGYAYGLHFNSGGGAQDLKVGDDCGWRLQQCKLSIGDPAFGSAGGGGKMECVDCEIEFGETDAIIEMNAGLWLSLRNCTFTFTATPTNVFRFDTSNQDDGSFVEVVGCDLSAFSGTLVTSDWSSTQQGYHVLNFLRCRLASGVTVTSITGSANNFRRAVINMYACSVNEATNDYLENLRFHQHVVGLGTATEDTSAYLNGQAPDQASGGWSIKMTSKANVSVATPYIYTIPGRWVTGLDAAKTVTVEITHSAGAALKDDEVWLEVEYPDNDTAAGIVLTDFKGAASTELYGDPLAAAADQATSTESWTGAGTYKQKLSVTTSGSGATQGKEGPITVRVCLAKASTTIYVDPAITVA